MADGGLRGAVDFGKRAPVGRIEEDRIVAESVVPPRLRSDGPLDDALGLEDDPAADREGHGGDEPRAAAV